MSGLTKGSSHEYEIKEDGEVAAKISVDFYPYKEGIAVTVEMHDGVTLASLAYNMRTLSRSLSRAARGEVRPDWISVNGDESWESKEGPF